MAIRVEWLNDNHTILCLTVRESLNWQEARRILNEWVIPMISNAQQSIAFIADLSDSNLFKADADLLIRRIFYLLGDSAHARALAVVGVSSKYPDTSIISANSRDEAIEQLTLLLAKNTLA